jgi:prepilin-type N-terminal cleavage/methylation domain-containing protein
MQKQKGYTLVELLVVVSIVVILAAVAIPILRGRIDAANWSEGKALMGSIGQAIRTYTAARNETLYNFDELSQAALGFLDSDLDGVYFDKDDFSWTGDYDVSTNRLTFTIIATAGEGIAAPSKMTLNQDGIWQEFP